MVSKVWETMNDLEMVTSKIVSAREIIDTAAEAIQKHDYDKAETLAMAAYEFLGYYLDEFDEKFKLAWQETVLKEKGEDPCMPPWGHSNLEYLIKHKEPVSCDKDDPSPECKKSWTSFWEEDHFSRDIATYQGSTVSSVQYTEEEMNEMCDKASYDDMISRGYTMTDDGFWIPPENQNKSKKWVLPTKVDGLTGDVFVNLPDDLLEAANLVEGDYVEWIDQGDGSYLLKKVK